MQLQDLCRETDEDESISLIVKRLENGEVVKKGYAMIQGRLRMNGV